jgi:hypothetical protein
MPEIIGLASGPPRAVGLLAKLALANRLEASLVLFEISWGQLARRQSDGCRGTRGIQRCGYESPRGRTLSAPVSLLFGRLDTEVRNGKTWLLTLIRWEHNTLSHR